ncbi:thiol S-methyltransferase TMT1B-like [Dermacentor andersoni]|uniref:thiol S-methyltransferase TMT1B-like n=1 Tax=Dermacentor andersoni TaxID=34620 RepID=UPI0024171A9C|nr:putative methyltransferase-like protein 7A [Dermacentor andersoni]
MRLLCQLCGVVWVTLILTFGIILLPALLVSRKLREMYFVTSLRVGNIIYADGMASARRAALKPLEFLESRDPALQKEGALRVLEIGAGSGANFEHITRKIKYTNVDPNPEFCNVFLKELKRYPKIELERLVECHGENMNELENEQFDVVLFTYLLCSVQDGRRVLEEAKRVLVKGGQLIFLEHVAHPERTWPRLLQSLITPLWKITCANCHLDRDSAKLIENAGFSQVTTDYIYVDMCTILSYQVFGVAIP